MSYTITAYTTEVFQEFSLPAADNADHTIVFSAERFGLKQDVALLLDVINGQWRILPSKHYTVRSDGVNHQEFLLQESHAITLMLSDGALSLVICRRPGKLDAGIMFDISGIAGLTIGRENYCTICYREMELISGKHAEIIRSGDRFVLVDHSRNGTYLNERRVMEPTVLRFGDIIRIFGLSVIFLGSVIRVQSVHPFRVTDEVRLRRAIAERCRSRTRVPKETAEAVQEHYHRSPRSMVQLYTEPMSIEPPPEKHESEKRPLAMVIGPSFTMAIPMLLGTGFMIYARSQSSYGGSSAFMYIGLITAVTDAIIGVIWALVNLRYAGKKERHIVVRTICWLHFH